MLKTFFSKLPQHRNTLACKQLKFRIVHSNPIAFRLFCTTHDDDAKPGRKMTEGYHRTYEHDPRVSMILKSSNSNLNMLEKHRYTSLIKK
jgi:hypothetical protein